MEKQTISFTATITIHMYYMKVKITTTRNNMRETCTLSTSETPTREYRMPSMHHIERKKLVLFFSGGCKTD